MICPVCKTSILGEENTINFCPTCRVEAPLVSSFLSMDSYNAWNTMVANTTYIVGEPLDSIFARAIGFYRSGNFEDARRALEVGMDNYPSSIKLHFWHLMSKNKINYLGNPEENDNGLCVFPLYDFPSLIHDEDYQAIVQYSNGEDNLYINSVKHIEKERIKRFTAQAAVKRNKKLAKAGKDTLASKEKSYTPLKVVVFFILMSVMIAITSEFGEEGAGVALALIFFSIFNIILDAVTGRKKKKK